MDFRSAPPLANVKQAALVLYGIDDHAHQVRLYRAIHNGKIPAIRMGERGIQIPMEALRKYLAGEEISPHLLQVTDRDEM